MLEQCTDEDEEIQIETELSDLYIQMQEKADSYDDYLLKLDASNASYDAQIVVFQKEIDRLKRKKKANDKVKERFFTYILPQAIKTLGDGEQFATDRSTYKYVTKMSPLVIENVNLLPEKYFIKQPDKIDNRTLRNDAIKAFKAGTKVEGAHVMQERYVRKY